MPLKTILLDLDDTLLTTSTNQFIGAYLQRLGNHAHTFADPGDFVQYLLKATRTMQANQDPNVTNEQAFYDSFFGFFKETEQQALLDSFAEFYATVYPQLQAHTTARPSARPMVQHLLKSGSQVAVATNPLFPATAIEQRLDWAGVGDLPFALVTTMENMHFSKPNVRYYEEILQKLEADPHTTIMVGNDPTNDIAPAAQLGLQTWWITDHLSPADIQAITPTPPATHHGSLAEFQQWVQTQL